MQPSSLTFLRPAREVATQSASDTCKITLIVLGILLTATGISLGITGLTSMIQMKRIIAISLLVGGSTLGPLMLYLVIVKNNNDSPILASTPSTESQTRKAISLPIPHSGSSSSSPPSVFPSFSSVSSLSTSSSSSASLNISSAEGSRKIYNESLGYAYKSSNPPGEEFRQTVQYMKSELKKHHKLLGSSVVNGDCFFHSLAQALNCLGKDHVTVVQLRHEVGEYIAAQRRQGNDGWIRREYNKFENILGTQSYEDYCQRVSQSWTKEIAPLWGGPSLEGRILCEIYKINLVVWSGIKSTELSMCAQDPNEAIRIPGAVDTLEIGLLQQRNHYVPVFNE